MSPALFGWTQSPERRSALRKVARHVAIILGTVALAYLITANLALRTRWLRELVSEGPELELYYESAYSLWPGRVAFRQLVLTSQDYDLQLAIQVETGSIDVSLHELLLRRFRGIGLRGSGLSFRLRQKVRQAEANAPHVAAYPPIAGYSDPPLYTGSKPEPDEASNMWEIALDDVRAQLAELWIFEYRYRGDGQLRGGFHLRPTRWFEVHPTRLELQSGALKMGRETAIRQLDTRISCAIGRTDVTGDDTLAAVLKSLSARLELTAEGLNPRAAELKLPAGVHAAGQGAAQASLGVTSGKLEPSSHAELRFDPLAVSSAGTGVHGALTARVHALEGSRLQGSLASPQLQLRGAREDEPTVFQQPRLDFQLHVDAMGSALDSLSLQLPSLEAPTLAVVTPLLERAGLELRLDGRLEARLGMQWARDRPLEGTAQVRVVGGVIELQELRASFAGITQIELEPASADGRVSSGSVNVDLDDVRVHQGGDDTTAPFRAGVRTGSLELGLQPSPHVSATWRVNLVPAKPFISMLLGAPLMEALATSVLDLARLDARTKVDADGESVRIELASLRSGPIAGQGYWRRPADQRSEGAFLLTTDVLNIGIEVNGTEVETDFPVSDDWLEEKSGASSQDAR